MAMTAERRAVVEREQGLARLTKTALGRDAIEDLRAAALYLEGECPDLGAVVTRAADVLTDLRQVLRGGRGGTVHYRRYHEEVEFTTFALHPRKGGA